MSNTKLNQAILRVAKTNPEFRKALQQELNKQGATSTKTAFGYESVMSSLFHGCLEAQQHLNDLNKIVEGNGYAWSKGDLLDLFDDDYPKNWVAFSTKIEKAKESLSRCYEAMGKLGPELAARESRKFERIEHMRDVAREMARTMPLTSFNAKALIPRLERDKVWNPGLKWKGPRGTEKLLLVYNWGGGIRHPNYDTKNIEVDIGGPINFKVKNTGNPKDIAARIWAELVDYGIA